MKVVCFAIAAVLVGGTAGAAAAAQNHERSGPGWQNPDQQAMRATRALNLLEEKGYGQFADFSRDSRDFTAAVTKNGQTFEVLINPTTGQVQPRIASNENTSSSVY